MQAAESMAASDTSFGMEWWPSGAPPALTETKPPAAMIRSNAPDRDEILDDRRLCPPHSIRRRRPWNGACSWQ
jgi:hypothetical protein